LNGRKSGQVVAIGVAAAVVLAHAAEIPKPGHAPELGCRGDESGSLLDITDTYMSELSGKRGVAMFATVPCAPFLIWTYHDRYPKADQPELPLKEYPLTAEGVRRRLEKWESESKAEAAVFVDFAPDSPDYRGLSDYESYREIEAIMNRNPRFHLSRQWQIAERGCKVSLWTHN
jgi:hypothetical protein